MIWDGRKKWHTHIHKHQRRPSALYVYPNFAATFANKRTHTLLNRDKLYSFRIDAYILWVMAARLANHSWNGSPWMVDIFSSPRMNLRRVPRLFNCVYIFYIYVLYSIGCVCECGWAMKDNMRGIRNTCRRIRWLCAVWTSCGWRARGSNHRGFVKPMMFVCTSE